MKREMTAQRVYARGDHFPNEGFVQAAIENYFKNKGYELEIDKFADLVCVHPIEKKRWVIEAKGLSKSIGIDFRTGLGQILQKMTDENSPYALAVPELSSFLQQCANVPERVRKSLNLHWIVVSENGAVTEIAPEPYCK